MKSKRFRTKEEALNFVERLFHLWYVYGGRLEVLIENDEEHIVVNYARQ